MLCELFHPIQNSVGSLKQSMLPELPVLPALNQISNELGNEACILIPPVKEACLNSDEHSKLDETTFWL